MPVIRLETYISAPVERVFDLARDVDAHLASSRDTGERAIGGRTSGLLGLNDEVTWEAKHLGVRQRLTARITAFARPRMFVDEMQRGAFKSLRHLHLFEPHEGGTLMIDEMTFSAPFGILGRVAERLFLASYMRRFLIKRNEHIKRVAEENAGVSMLQR
jgi:ligand-binding SRPBCC domain-containing protein